MCVILLFYYEFCPHLNFAFKFCTFCTDCGIMCRSGSVINNSFFFFFSHYNRFSLSIVCVLYITFHVIFLFFLFFLFSLFFFVSFSAMRKCDKFKWFWKNPFVIYIMLTKLVFFFLMFVTVLFWTSSNLLKSGLKISTVETHDSDFSYHSLSY